VKLKKHWIYGKPLDKENVLEECGDSLFYIVAMLQQCGFSLIDAMEYNGAKLAKRYPNGWTAQAAIERADKS
jgi:NTP pyrophosphatase (non-canonical NTP hydrolase)